MVKKFKERYDIDVYEYIDLKRPSMFKYDDMITVKMFGYKSRDEYYDKASSCWSIPYIKVPTLFMAAHDDPLIGRTGIDQKTISLNENTVLATNELGGHLGYHQSAWTQNGQCFQRACFDFLSTF
jgi:uncharacterized protein